MQSRACCFIGHSTIPVREMEQITLRLEETFDRLLTLGVTEFFFDGRPGFGELAARLAALRKQQNPGLRLVILLPYRGFVPGWPEGRSCLQPEILRYTDDVSYLYHEPPKRCLSLWRRTLISQCSHCVCWLKKKTGGTAKMVAAAQKQGLEITNLARSN